MNILTGVAVAMLVAGVAAPNAVYAASSNVPVHLIEVKAGMVKAKMVKFAVRNDSGSPLELKVGDQVMSIDSGKTIALKLEVGTRIVMNTATANHAAGEFIAQAYPDMADATLVIK